MVRVPLRHPVLQGNQVIADGNRALLRCHSVLAVNLISAPGAGKTTLLEGWIPRVQERVSVGVIEGDIATTLDAQRIAACGVAAVQINTHGACHLDADMIARALAGLDLAALDCLVIENVGNLVCPAEFDLGEALRVILLSTTEGADKPAKYPASFRRADAIILNKVDLLPYVNFDLKQFHAALRELNPGAPVFPVSALSGEGMASWTDWLLARRRG